MRMKADHNGAKNGGHFGKREEAKRLSKRKRRQDDAEAERSWLSIVLDESRELKYPLSDWAKAEIRKIREKAACEPCSWCYGDGFVGTVPCRDCDSTGEKQ